MGKVHGNQNAPMGKEAAAPTKIMTTPVGLTFPAEVTYESWERAGRQIATIVSSSAWYLGDWLVYGQDRYADRYRRAVDTAGLDYQTLRNYAWVARSFASWRRRRGLSFQHHAEVASLPSEEQDRWLDAAERDRWSRNVLRRELQRSRSGPAAPQQPVLPKVSVGADRVARWRRAAEVLDTPFDRWIVEALDRAAAGTVPQPRDTVEIRELTEGL